MNRPDPVPSSALTSSPRPDPQNVFVELLKKYDELCGDGETSCYWRVKHDLLWMVSAAVAVVLDDAWVAGPRTGPLPRRVARASVVAALEATTVLEGTVRVDGELCGGLTWPGGWVGQGLADWAIERWCAGAEHSSQHWRCGHEWLEAPGEIVGGGDTPCERALFRLFDAVEGLLDGEKRLFEPGDPVGDRLLCDACRVWSPMVRELSEGVDGFAYFREVYRLFRDS